MKAYQCSKCELLRDYDEYVQCGLGLDIRPPYREKGGVKECKENFKPLEKRKQWHTPFYWEGEK